MKLYRYINYNESIGGIDESGEYICHGHKVKICLIELEVEKETPKGYRLIDGTFVLKGIGKRFAYPTKELTRKSFVARKKRQIKILSNQLRNAEKALDIINNYDTRQTETSNPAQQ